MNKDDVIRMAREADSYADKHGPSAWRHPDEFAAFRDERFAALVAAAKDAEHKEAMRWDIHSCGPTCTRYACVATREAVAAEREACAKVCDAADKSTHPSDLADAIRARGQA